MIKICTASSICGLQSRYMVKKAVITKVIIWVFLTDYKPTGFVSHTFLFLVA